MEFVKILLDTHVILWWLTDDSRLTEAARKLIADPENEVLASAASAWEISTKHRLGKLPEAADVAMDLDDILIRAGMTPLPITVAHAIRAGALEQEHRDPFDRMLVAQGQLESVPVVTGDPAFSLFEVELIW